MTKWEYKEHRSPSTKQMNELGKEGWECYFIDSINEYKVCYFKRPIEDDATQQPVSFPIVYPKWDDKWFRVTSTTVGGITRIEGHYEKTDGGKS